MYKTKWHIILVMGRDTDAREINHLQTPSVKKQVYTHTYTHARVKMIHVNIKVALNSVHKRQ